MMKRGLFVENKFLEHRFQFKESKMSATLQRIKNTNPSDLLKGDIYKVLWRFTNI